MADIDVRNLGKETDFESSDRNILRLGLMLNHLGTFLIPSLLFSFLYYRNRICDFLYLTKLPDGRTLMIWIMILLVSYPMVAALVQLNESLPLPNWMLSSQEATFGLLKHVLTMEGITELAFSLLLVGLLPALGEEFLFRGIIQNKLQQTINPHWAILISALLFGLFHMQFERIIPLSFLGLVLGYCFYFSKNLWLAVFVHFLNNAVQVIALYKSDISRLDNIDDMPNVPWYLVLASALILIWLFSFVRRTKAIDDQPGT